MWQPDRMCEFSDVATEYSFGLLELSFRNMTSDNNGAVPVQLHVAEDAVKYGGALQPAQVAVPFKYAVQIRDIAKCPVQPNFTNIGMAYRFAKANVDDDANYLPIALLEPDRSLPGRKPVTECCAGWSLSMFTTLDALENRVRKTGDFAPKFMKRVGDHFIQLKLTPACGVHTDVNNEGHFEFFERETFEGKKAVVSHGKMKL